MGISPHNLRDYIIQPTLKAIGLWSLAAENLLLGTAAQESRLGTYLHQKNGPALGIYQIEPNTHQDIYINFLMFQPSLKILIDALRIKTFTPGNLTTELIGNLYYATAIARLIYYRADPPLPMADDIKGLAAYWKMYYNTHRGKGKEKDFVEHYENLILLKE